MAVLALLTLQPSSMCISFDLVPSQALLGRDEHQELARTELNVQRGQDTETHMGHVGRGGQPGAWGPRE